MSMFDFYDALLHVVGGGLPAVFGRLSIASRFLLRGAMTILLLTSAAVLVASIKALRGHRLSDTYPGYGGWVQLVGIVVTFPLLLTRIIPDFLRVWIHLKPSLPEYIILGIIPEWIIVAIWFSLAHIVPCSDRDLHKTEEEVRERVRGEWYQVFESRIDELGDLKQRALEEMETVEAWAENTIQTITLKSFYD